MKAEVVKAVGGKMKPGRWPDINIKVGVQGWGDTLDTFEVDGEAMTELATRGTPSLPRVASIVGSCLDIQEVYCSKSTSDMSVHLVLSRIADHLDRVGGRLEHLQLNGLSPLSPSEVVEPVFKILKLSKTWKIKILFWYPHGSRLAGLNGDTNISTGQYQLRMDNIILIKHSSVVFFSTLAIINFQSHTHLQMAFPPRCWKHRNPFLGSRPQVGRSGCLEEAVEDL